MPKAPFSIRALDHVTLSFGMVSIPVSVYTGTVSQHGITRKEFVQIPTEVPVRDEHGEVVTNAAGDPVTEDGVIEHPVGRGQIDKETGDLLDPDAEVVKKIMTEYGGVYVEDDEIEKLFEITPKSIVVKGFQPLHLFHQGHYVPKKLNFVEPMKVTVKSKKVYSPGAAKALAMLFQAMREEGACAVVEFTTRGTPKPAILLPDGTLWEVWHTDAIREQRELPEVEVAPAIVAQGRMLVKSAWSDEPMDLTDTRSELIQTFANEKAEAGDFDKPEASEEPAGPDTSADDDNLLAALMASVEAAKAS